MQKILSDEVDDKAWNHYLKGNRGVFTRRAVRLLGGTETRAIAAQYESDPEFQNAVNHYVHDFEAMLRRVLAERDGGMIAVTLMSSDMGKLYAALAPGGGAAPLGSARIVEVEVVDADPAECLIGDVKRGQQRARPPPRAIRWRGRSNRCGALSAWPGTRSAPDLLIGLHPERQQQEGG